MLFRSDVQDARFRQAAARYRQVVLNAAEEVENALAAYRRNLESESELAQAVSTARSAARLAGDQYKAGAVSFQTLLDAERSLVLTLDEHIATQGNVILSIVQLYKALGGGWDSRGASGVTPLPPIREEIDAPAATTAPVEILPTPQNPAGLGK